MMRKIILVSIAFIASFDFVCLAQTADSEINLTKINTGLLESLFIKKLAESVYFSAKLMLSLDCYKQVNWHATLIGPRLKCVETRLIHATIN